MASREWPQLWSVSTDCQTVTVLVLHMRIHVHSMSMQLSTHWAQWNPCQSVQSPCFPHTGHNGTSVCVVTMLSTHRAQWNLSLCSHHAFHAQGTAQSATAESSTVELLPDAAQTESSFSDCVITAHKNSICLSLNTAKSPP